MAKRYIVGIDLGTTNSVLAYLDATVESPRTELLEIPQLVAAGTVEKRTSLPSFLYLGAPHEIESKALEVPGVPTERYAVGHFARQQAAEAPQRTVGAAKSWLSHRRVDRREAILPWRAPDDVEKVSPVTASQRYLEHLAAVWDTTFPETPLAEQTVVLTVPASFDAVARDLTREAALAAGLPTDLVLLEEPQAALYAWLEAIGDAWRKRLRVGDQLLVCDIGGGTCDFSLIGVQEEEGELQLDRVAVGNHLLVGGDNMDLAVVHFVAGKFKEQGVELDPWQSVALWHSCRTAKETVLAVDGPETHTISVLGRGSRLIGGTVSVEVHRDDIRRLLMDGFLPPCGLGDRPQRQRVSGFQEIGLPFESDAAVTRHLAQFLTTNAVAADSLPHYVLFNGGVFKAAALRRRLLEVIGGWSDSEHHVAPLEGEEDLDHAVARGAAFYGLTKERGGVRIRGGVARTYYVGIESAGLAIPGAARPLQALCVIPFGMEEGSEIDVPSGEIGLVLGESVEFRFFSSTTRKEDPPGTLLETWSAGELSETAPLVATLAADEDRDEPYVPVRFRSRITELGVCELWCVDTRSEQRWKLEFSVRDTEEE